MVMIIASEEDLEVGSVHESFTNEKCDALPTQPFLVVAKSNAREWEEHYLSNGGDPELARNVLDHLYLFYRIHTN